ncbi:uncharacterized protein LOC121063182 isoform X8 [Cygnus olor]|uniref:uncharacterized protein LOC121063182 isoform X8 n=1 Tax=Cygnus olor TaxID=8869 RepID=UPI001ADEBC55|nr:uncharacterized protein LOC121063182 isoform X8 [Cygnus olor]
MRIEGCIIGIDEYMNLVLDDAGEIHSKTKSRKQLGVSCVCATRVTRGLKPARMMTMLVLHIQLLSWILVWSLRRIPEAVLVKCLHGILLLSLPVWVPQVQFSQALATRHLSLMWTTSLRLICQMGPKAKVIQVPRWVPELKLWEMAWVL